MNNDTIDVSVDKEFETLLQPLSDQEYQGLEEDIIKHGCLNPIITWNGLIVDGHNRFQICRKLDLEHTSKEISFADRDEAKLWILGHQLKRRNLNDFQRGEMALRMKEIITKKAKENQRAGGGSVHLKSDKPVDTLKEMAQTAEISRDTLFKIEKIAENATEEEKASLRAGKTKINTVYNKLKAHENPSGEENPQEKQMISLVDGIEHKVEKLEKVSPTLLEKMRERLVVLSQKLRVLCSALEGISKRDESLAACPIALVYNDSEDHDNTSSD